MGGETPSPSAGSLASLPLTARGPISARLGAEAAGYHLTVAADARLRGTSQAQRLDSTFSRTGISLSAGDLRVGLGVGTLSAGGRALELGGTTPSARANEARYTRPGVAAWFRNGPLGVEQGFTIARALPGAGSSHLSLSMAISGNARPSLSSAGQSVLFARGTTALRYGALRTTDAAGRVLPSHLSLSAGVLSIDVDARGARYPLQIDPLIERTGKLTGAGEVGAGAFGLTVAISADGATALIGGPHDAEFEGSVWVFTRSGSRS